MGKGKSARNRKTKLVLVFDEDEREKYLTGFRKRKNERRKKAQEELKVQLAEEVKRKRKEHKEKVSRSAQHYVERLEEAEQLVQSAASRHVYEGQGQCVSVTDLSHLCSDAYLGPNMGDSAPADLEETSTVEAHSPEDAQGATKASSGKRLNQLQTRLLKLQDPKHHATKKSRSSKRKHSQGTLGRKQPLSSKGNPKRKLQPSKRSH